MTLQLILMYNYYMTFLQTIWLSILAMGWIKLILTVILIGVLSRIHAVLGLLAVALFIAYLANWI